jgi:hypothetical protein
MADGEHLGWRQVEVSWSDEEHRMFSGHTWFEEGRRKRRTFEQHLSANAEQGRPASFSSTLEGAEGARTVQARRAGITWTVTVDDARGPRTHHLPHTRVDLSSVDLFDPMSERGLKGRSHVRLLSAETGKIEAGPVEYLGNEELVVGGEPLYTAVYRWSTEVGVHRYWYASNGWLVRFEVPLQERLVVGELYGGAPRSEDEFPVPAAFRPGPIDVLDLPLGSTP